MESLVGFPNAMSKPLESPAKAASSILDMAGRQLPIEQALRVKGFGRVLLRPILLEDEPLMIQFHRTLSEDTIYNRYFQHICLESRIKHDRLVRICTNSDESFALVAFSPKTPKREAAILSVGRLSKTDDPLHADFALLVIDQAQGCGIGSALMKRLLNLARACGFRQLVGEVLVANHEMLYVCRQFGFSLHTVSDEGIVEIALDL